MNRYGKMTDEHVDALFTLFTTPLSSHGLDASLDEQQYRYGDLAPKERRNSSIGPVFSQCKLKLDCRRRILDLLHRVFASSIEFEHEDLSSADDFRVQLAFCFPCS
ncbi:hypothetical protein Gpo141_00013872, partial [Globisporangium polare]